MNSLLTEAVFPSLRWILAALLLTFSGCRVFDAAVDCNTICTRYKDCYDGSYDVAGCASRCRDRAASDQATGDAVNRCEACINDRACASATFNCATDCSNVVP